MGQGAGLDPSSAVQLALAAEPGQGPASAPVPGRAAGGRGRRRHRRRWRRRSPGRPPREREIVALIAAGRSNKGIGEELGISPATAARHVANILLKLGFSSRAQIAAWVSRTAAGPPAPPAPPAPPGDRAT